MSVFLVAALGFGIARSFGTFPLADVAVARGLALVSGLFSVLDALHSLGNVFLSANSFNALLFPIRTNFFLDTFYLMANRDTLPIGTHLFLVAFTGDRVTLGALAVNNLGESFVSACFDFGNLAELALFVERALLLAAVASTLRLGGHRGFGGEGRLGNGDSHGFDGRLCCRTPAGRSALVSAALGLADFDVGETLFSQGAACCVGAAIACALLHTLVTLIGGNLSGLCAHIRFLTGLVAGQTPLVAPALVAFETTWATCFGFFGTFSGRSFSRLVCRAFADLSAFCCSALGLTHLEVGEASSARRTADSVVAAVASLVRHVGKTDIGAVFLFESLGF